MDSLIKKNDKKILLNNFKYNVPQFNTFYETTVLLEIIPMKITSLSIQLGERNESSDTYAWKPSVKIRKKGTNEYVVLDDSTTKTVNAYSIEIYNETFTSSASFGDFEYDAISYVLRDPNRSTYSNIQVEPYVLVNGTITDGN